MVSLLAPTLSSRKRFQYRVQRCRAPRTAVLRRAKSSEPMRTGALGDLYDYDPTTGAWRNLTYRGRGDAVPAGRYALGFAAAEDQLYVFGGVDFYGSKICRHKNLACNMLESLNSRHTQKILPDARFPRLYSSSSISPSPSTFPSPSP